MYREKWSHGYAASEALLASAQQWLANQVHVNYTALRKAVRENTTRVICESMDRKRRELAHQVFTSEDQADVLAEVVVFNHLSWTRSETVEFTFEDPAGDALRTHFKNTFLIQDVATGEVFEGAESDVDGANARHNRALAVAAADGKKETRNSGNGNRARFTVRFLAKNVPSFGYHSYRIGIATEVDSDDFLSKDPVWDADRMRYDFRPRTEPDSKTSINESESGNATGVSTNETTDSARAEALMRSLRAPTSGGRG